MNNAEINREMLQMLDAADVIMEWVMGLMLLGLICILIWLLWNNSKGDRDEYYD